MNDRNTFHLRGKYLHVVEEGGMKDWGQLGLGTVSAFVLFAPSAFEGCHALFSSLVSGRVLRSCLIL